MMEGFSVRTVTGFGSPAIHSDHPYADESSAIAMVKMPIRVASENALLQYEDIALVEPGDPETSFGDYGMWDYVIVEGTKDGLEWLPLIDGYDARGNPSWLDAYNENRDGDQSMFVRHRIDLLQTFHADDVIFIRFRLLADGSVTGWGWVIDNIEIQTPATSGEIPSEYQLSQNYPNPFNTTTAIRYGLPERGRVVLKIYNMIGQEVITLVDEEQMEGIKYVEWKGSDRYGKSVSSGVYVYSIEAGRYTESKKMILVR